MAIETAEQWDDEWWRIWEDARPAHDGEAAARHADLEMSELYGLRPRERRIRIVIAEDPEHDDRVAEMIRGLLRDGRLVIRNGLPTPPRRGWLRRALDWVLG